jgi:PAS domain S-box-containing protein
LPDPEILRRALGCAPVLVRQLDGTILFCTAALGALYGWPPEEAAGKVAHELLSTGFPAPLEQIEAELLRTGAWTGELRKRRRDGGVVWVASRWTLQRDQAGAPTIVIQVDNDITGRKLAEERERTVLDCILKSTDAMLVYLDPDFNFVMVNPAYAATCNMRPEDMIGKNHFALYPDAENEAIIRRVRDTGEPAFYKDKPFRFPDQPARGITYWDWSLMPVREPSGKVAGLVFSLRETTNAKRAGDVLDDSALFPHQNPSPVLRASRDGILLFANPSAEALLADWQPGVGRKIPVPVGQAVADAIAQGAPRELDFRSGGRDYSFLIAPVAGQEYANLYARDVTERTQAEQALRASEERFRTLFTTMSDGFAVGEAIWDEKGVPVDFYFLEINDAFERHSGLTRDILGKPIRQALPNIEKVWIGRYCRVAVTGTPERFEEYNEDTRRHYSVFCYSPSRGRFAIVFSDVTERKHEDERLREAQKLESLGFLAGGVAHDFNNLLTGIVGNASLAQELLPDGHPSYDLLDTVMKTGAQAAQLTRQMLAYAGKGQFVVEPVQLSQLLPEISGLVQPSISRTISLEFDLDPDLPPVEADRGQMRQVFMNLVINAAEAIGGNTGRITVRTGVLNQVPEGLPPGTYVYLEVRDTGCGMDHVTKSKIFDPFFSTKFTGRGLGLAAVSGIVRAHKGAITVSSVPGHGSCFTVVFPAATQ